MFLQTKTSALIFRGELGKVSELQRTLHHPHGFSLWAAKAFVQCVVLPL